MCGNFPRKIFEMPPTRKLTCWALSAVVFVSGCGRSAPTINGSVTYNGEPVKNGYISFRPAEGRGQSFAARIENGQYNAVDRVTPGMKRVIVSGIRESAPITREESQRAAATAIDGPTDYIAENAEGNSKEVEILPGDQTLDFSITGAPIPQ